MLYVTRISIVAVILDDTHYLGKCLLGLSQWAVSEALSRALSKATSLSCLNQLTWLSFPQENYKYSCLFNSNRRPFYTLHKNLISFYSSHISSPHLKLHTWDISILRQVVRLSETYKTSTVHIGLHKDDPESVAIREADGGPNGQLSRVRSLGTNAFLKHMTALRSFHKLCGHTTSYIDDGVHPRSVNPMNHPDVLVNNCYIPHSCC